MTIRRMFTVALIALTAWIVTALPSPRGHAADTTAPATVDDGKVELAEHFYTLAKDYLNRAPAITHPDLKVAAALFREAERLNSDEPRFPRLAYEALDDAGDISGAIAEVQAYQAAYAKAHKGDHDRIADQTYVDLNLERMQSVDAKIAWLDTLLNTKGLSADLHAHAAVVEAQLYQERAQPDKALDHVKQAIGLDPLNITARQLKLDLTGTTEPIAQQLSDELALIRCNPAQPAAVARVGQILAQSGLVEPAIRYLNLATKLHIQMGVQMSPDFAQDYGAELFIGGKTQQASDFMTKYNVANPNDGGGWMVRLAIDRANDKNGLYAAAMLQAEAAMLDSMGQVHAALLQSRAESPTTGPTTQAAPGSSGFTLSTSPAAPPTSAYTIDDVSADVSALKDANGSKLQEPFMASASHLAWFLVYFKKDVKGERQLLDALAPILPETDPLVQRLEGWLAYDNGDFAGARAKWASIASTDPLAQLGVILMDLQDAKTKVPATAQARRLLSQNPSGILGAVLWNALASATGPVNPGPQSDQIQTQISQFPEDLLAIIDTPLMFYDITLTPRRTSIEYGQPLLLDLVVRNVGAYDLTIGPGGTIRNDLWFDGQIVGLENKAVSNVTFDRLVGRHVLKQGEAIEQTVRVDEGPLLAVFRQNPSMLMEFEIYMKTNPVRSGGGVMVPGPCGLRVDTLNAISRLGTPVLEDASRQAELEKLSSSAATEQLRIMEFLDESTQYFKPPPQLPGLHLAAPTTGPVDDALWTADARAAIMPLAASPLAAVRGAAMCALAGLPGADRATLIAGMLADPDPMVRLLGLDSAERESDHGLAADQAARDDSDDLVRALAQARLDLLVAPATQSTAQPAAGTGAVAVPTTAQRSATTNPS